VFPHVSLPLVIFFFSIPRKVPVLLQDIFLHTSLFAPQLSLLVLLGISLVDVRCTGLGILCEVPKMQSITRPMHVPRLNPAVQLGFEELCVIYSGRVPTHLRIRS